MHLPCALPGFSKYHLFQVAGPNTENNIFQKVMRENHGTTKREESWDLTESCRGFVRLEMLSEIGGRSVTELKHW